MAGPRGVFPGPRWRRQGHRGAWLAGAAQHVSCPAGYAAPYLTVFSENSIDVFDVRKAEWVQTVPLKKVRACPDPWPWSGVQSGSAADLCACCLRCDP